MFAMYTFILKCHDSIFTYQTYNELCGNEITSLRSRSGNVYRIILCYNVSVCTCFVQPSCSHS